MNAILSTTILSLGIFFGTLADQETKVINEIDRLYHIAKSSSDLHKLHALVHESIQVFPESDQLFWRQGRTYYKLGNESESESEKIRYFLLCMEQTKKSLELNPKSANGYFFSGLCNGKRGQTQGIWSSLGTIEPLKNDMEAAIGLDPSVNDGGPHRALGNLYFKLPYLLGGDLKRSIRHFREAVRLGPQFGENHLGLAEAYIQNNDFLLARDILQTLLNIKSGPFDEESVREWQSEARSLLKKISEQSGS